MTDEIIMPLPLLSVEKADEKRTFLSEFANDVTFVDLKMRVMDLLEEHNYGWMRTYFPFGYKGIPTFGAFRWPMLRWIYIGWICSILQVLLIVILGATHQLEVGTTCMASFGSLLFTLGWIYAAILNIDKDCKPKLKVHLEEVRKVHNLLILHGYDNNCLVSRDQLIEALFTCESLYREDVERMKATVYWASTSREV